MKLKPQHMFYLSIGLAVVLVAALIGVLVVPTISRMNDLNDQIEEAEKQVQANEALLKRRQEVKRRAAETDMRLLRLSNEIPQTPELPSLIIELHDVVNESGMDFSSITPAKSQAVESEGAAGASASYLSNRVTLKVVGTWQDTVDLLQRLRRLTRQVRVVSFDCKPYTPPPNDSTWEGLNPIDTDLVVEVYSMPAESGEGADVPPPPAATGQ